MPIHLGWPDIAARLALTILAGTLIGINRTERGRPAGLRTTLLVCLAASVAMIQTNLLMATAGKATDSFISLDLMRLPLGVLSGMGFIGAGAIVRRDNLVLGITTAATLWFVTIIGLCFGGGQLRLGSVALALGLAVLWGLKWFEQRTKRDRKAELTVITTLDGPTEKEIRAHITKSNDKAIPLSSGYRRSMRYRRMVFDINWRARPEEASIPRFVDELAEIPSITKVDWHPY